MIDPMINTACVKLWGLGRDRAGVLKPAQVIKTSWRKTTNMRHEDPRPSQRAGLGRGVLQVAWEGLCSVIRLSSTLTGCLCSPPRPLSGARVALLFSYMGKLRPGKQSAGLG